MQEKNKTTNRDQIQIIPLRNSSVKVPRTERKVTDPSLLRNMGGLDDMSKIQKIA